MTTGVSQRCSYMSC